MFGHIPPQEVSDVAYDFVTSELSLQMVPAEDITTLCDQLDYTPEEYEHSMRDMASATHRIFTDVNYPYLKRNPFAHAFIDPQNSREWRQLPDEIFLKHSDGYDFGIDLDGDLIVMEINLRKMKMDYGDGNYISSMALPLKNMWIKGKNNVYLDLNQLFQTGTNQTFTTFVLGGTWHDSQTGDVLVSVPLRRLTYEELEKSREGKGGVPTCKYDMKKLKYSFLHEKVHQYLSAHGLDGLNTDANCNETVALVIKTVNEMYPDGDFLSLEEFEEWVSWQKRTSTTYSV